MDHQEHHQDDDDDMGIPVDLGDDDQDLGNDDPEYQPPIPPLADKKPIRDLMDVLREYIAEASKNRAQILPELESAIELLDILNDEGAQLSAYDRIASWHMNHLQHQKRVTMASLIKKLRKRYNVEALRPKMVKTILPSCGTKVAIPCHDFKSVLLDVLTDPRIRDEDYLFFDDNPLADPPPDSEWTTMRDINDGLAYRRTHDELIKPNPYTESGRKRVLLPVIPYMDGCSTGQFMNLELEIVKFTLGIFNKHARERDCCWRNMGAVPKYVASKQGAKTLIEESTHNEATEYLTDSDVEDDEDDADAKSQDSGVTEPDSEDEREETHAIDPKLEVHRAQNLHHILSIILQGYKECQDSEGIEFDLFYKGNIHKVLFVPFIIFVKGEPRLRRDRI